MNNLLNQDDLNALWEKSAGDGADPQRTGDGKGADAGGSVSQADLDALWAGLSESQAKPAPEQDVPPQESGSISQADLDNLYAGLSALQNGGDAQKQTEPSTGDGGLSQADLDKLWGAVADADRAEAPPAEEPKAAPIGENLSQDDIDKLLADLGR
jgi:hypothetical protein